MKRLFLLGCLGALFLSLAGCDKPEVKTIDLSKKETPVPKVAPSHKKPLRVAVGGMITPKEGFAYYRQFLDYLGAKLGRPVEYVDRENYAEINNMLKSGDIDVAFVCSLPYVNGHDEFGLELLVAPQAYGKTVYFSYIIVAKTSAINRFTELRGKTFAFTDPLSNSGKLVPTYMLACMKTTPERFFSKYIYTYGHDKAIKAVAQGLVDGAAVDSLIWDYADHVNPVYTANTRIIEKSLPYGIPPVVIRAGLDRQLKEEIRKVFLTTHEDNEGREILKKMMIDRFVVIDNSAYDSIRAMKAWVEKR